MDKYFRYEDVKDYICSFYLGNECDCDNSSGCKKLDKLPIADVAPVIHAHWEIKTKWIPLALYADPLDWDRYDEKTHSEEVDYYACSKCGFDGGSWKPSWKYCPNCGARMDKEE